MTTPLPISDANFLEIPTVQGMPLDEYIRNVVDEHIRNTKPKKSAKDAKSVENSNELSEDQTNALNIILSKTERYCFGFNCIFLGLNCKHIELYDAEKILGGPYSGSGDDMIIFSNQPNFDFILKHIQDVFTEIKKEFQKMIREWCEIMRIKTSQKDIDACYFEVYEAGKICKPNEKLFKAAILAFCDCNGVMSYNDKFGEMYNKLKAVIL